jgi:hypothetical protein
MRLSTSLLVALLAAPAMAEEGEVQKVALPAENDVGVDSSLGGSVQRFGMMLDVRGHYRRRLYASTDEAFKDNYLGVSLIDQFAVVFNHVGAQVDFAPTSFLRVSAGYQFVGYFSALGTMRTRTNCAGAGLLPAIDSTCDYQPELPDAPGKGGLGHRAFVEAVLQVKVSRFLAIGGARFDRWWMRALENTSGDDYWVNEYSGQPQAMVDNVFSAGGALLFEAITEAPTRPQLLIGATDDVSWVFSTEVVTHKVGPVAILRIPKWKSFRELTVAFAVQFYTHERYLVGKVPFFGLALGGSTANFL